MKRQALGKGLDVLLPPTPLSPTALIELDLDRIQPNPLQPRLRFEPGKLEELAASIKENGVLQPIVVRKSGGGYEIVVGERRWRAAQNIGLERIPAIVQHVSDEKMLELALVENIQRDELSPIEEGQAYQLLAEQFALTHDEIARRVGRSRAAVTNSLRLLRLPSSSSRENSKSWLLPSKKTESYNQSWSEKVVEATRLWWENAAGEPLKTSAWSAFQPSCNTYQTKRC